MSGFMGRDLEKGFTFVELMVSLSLTLILLLSLFGMVDVNQKVSRNQQDIASMQQNGRAAMEFIIRDLHSAGYKLVNNGNLETFGVIFPNADCSNTHTTNAITIWSNPGDAQATIVRDMPQPSSEVVVDTVSGFHEGDQAIIIGTGNDGLMHFDAFIITEVQDNQGNGEKHLQHRPPINPNDFSTKYRAGSLVLIMDTITYYLASDGTGVQGLFRKFRGQAAAAVATEVTSLAFRYFGEGNPPPELTNIDSPSDRRAIRKVEVTLGVRTERNALDTRARRVLTWTSDVSPRNLVFKRNL